MSHSQPAFRRLCLPVFWILLFYGWTTHATAGQLVQITTPNAQIKTGSRIQATVPAKSLMWVFRFSEDQQWMSVKVPGRDEYGWMVATDAINVTISESRRDEWNAASTYNEEWNRLLKDGKYEDAAAVAQTAAETIERILTEEYGQFAFGHPAVATAWNQAGFALARGGLYAKAKPLYEKATVLSSQIIGRKQFETCVSRANLAEVAAYLGDNDTAVREFDASIPILEASPRDSVNLPVFYLRYGQVLARSDRVFDARSAFRKALTLVKRQYGDRSSEVAHVNSSAAIEFERAGLRTEALSHQKAALDIYREILDPEDPRLVLTLNRVGAYLAKLQRFAESRKFSEEALQIIRDNDGEPRSELPAALNNLGFALAMLGEHEAAEPTLAEAEEVMSAVAGKGSSMHSYPLKNKAILALHQGNTDEARRLLKRVRDIRLAATDTNRSTVAEANVLLARVASADGETKRCIELLKDAVVQFADSIGIDHPDTHAAIQQLREMLGDDEAEHESVDELIATARQKRRSELRAAVSPMADSSSTSIQGLERYRLKSVLGSALKSSPETTFSPLEVTVNNAAVRSNGKTIANLSRGAVVYGFRPERGQALINIPGQNRQGWISSGSAKDIVFAGERLKRLQAADQQFQSALNHYSAMELEKAESDIREALAVYAAEFADTHPATGTSRSLLAAILNDSGRPQQAISEAESSVAILRHLLGDDHLETALAMNELCNVYTSCGRPSDALPFGTEAMRVLVAADSNWTSDHVRAAGNIGFALASLSHLEAGREYLEYGLKISREKLGHEHATTGRMWGLLGRMFQEIFEEEASEEAFRKCYEISRKVSGDDHPTTLEAKARYGEAMILNNQIAAGRRLMEEARADIRKLFGEDNQTTIDADYQRAAILTVVGEASAGVAEMESVVERAEKVLGADHPTTQYYKEALGVGLYSAERYDESLATFLSILETYQRTMGDDSLSSMRAHNAVGVASAALGRLDVARRHYQQAHAMGRQLLGDSHPDVIAYHYNLGEIALMGRDYVAARPRVEDAVDFFQSQTEEVNDRLCLTRLTLGTLDAAQGNYRDALKTFDLTARDAFELIADILPSLSEKEQLAFLKQDFRDIRDRILSLAVDGKATAKIVTTTAEWNLNLKANSHDLLSRQLRAVRDSGANPEGYRRLIETREQLARMSLRTVPKSALTSHHADIQRLTEKEARLARELGASIDEVREQRTWVDLAQLRSAIAPNTVFVSFARFRRANYRYTSERTEWRSDRYVAWIIPATGQGEVRTVDLGIADRLDDAIRNAHRVIHSPESIETVGDAGEVAAAAEAEAGLQTLSDKILKPLLSAVGDVDEIVLSPDGQIWTVPWAALPINDGRFLVEKYRIRTLASGRELMRRHADAARPKRTVSAPLIVADPNFDAQSVSTQVARSENPRNRLRGSGTRFSESFRNTLPLPGTAVEAAAIKDSVEAFAGKVPRLSLQSGATESAVKRVKSPQTLVLSTHGFFYEDETEASSSRLGGRRLHQNPLLRCGLLLAGCNHAAEIGDQTDDGILTGLEIVNTDLRGTELVVLSACETGLGDVREGEGIAGLRQAFQLAGAEAVVASLWQVDDQSTARLMDHFFRNLADGMGKSEALQKAQLARIAARRERNGAAHPFFWAAFTLTGLD